MRVGDVLKQGRQGDDRGEMMLETPRKSLKRNLVQLFGLTFIHIQYIYVYNIHIK